MYLYDIYMVYTMNVICMKSTYSRNIYCIYHVYTMYIHGICMGIQLISCLAPGEVDAQGALGTASENSLEVQSGKTYKPIFFNLSHSRPEVVPKTKSVAGTRNKQAYFELLRPQFITDLDKIFKPSMCNNSMTIQT